MIKYFRIRPLKDIIRYCDVFGIDHDCKFNGRTFSILKENPRLYNSPFFEEGKKGLMYIRSKMIEKMGDGKLYKFNTGEIFIDNNLFDIYCEDDGYFYPVFMLYDDFFHEDDFKL